MARLRRGQKDRISDDIYRLLRRYNNGLRESELSNITGMDRRRLNNYLRELQAQQRAYKEGREWFADRFVRKIRQI